MDTASYSVLISNNSLSQNNKNGVSCDRFLLQQSNCPTVNILNNGIVTSVLHHDNNSSSSSLSSCQLYSAEPQTATNRSKKKNKRISLRTDDSSDFLFKTKLPHKTEIDNNLRFHPHFPLHQQQQQESDFQQGQQTAAAEIAPIAVQDSSNAQALSSKWIYPQEQIQQLILNNCANHRASDCDYGSTSARPATANSFATVTNNQQAPSSSATNMIMQNANWPNIIGADWDLQTGFELNPRMMSTPPYYNAAAESYAVCATSTNMRTAYSNLHPTNSYTPNTAAAVVAAAAAPFNFSFNVAANAYGYNNGLCTPNFADYYGLHYYGNSSASIAAMIGSSPVANSTLEITSRRSSSSGNNTTANVSDDFKSVQALNEELSLAQDSNITNTNVRKTFSPISKNATKQKKTKKRSAGSNGAYENMISTNSKAGSASHITPKLSSTHAFVWELEDLCIATVSDDFVTQLVEQVMRYAFHVDPIDELSELNQMNVEDAEMDETLTEHSELYSNTVIHAFGSVKPTSSNNFGNTLTNPQGQQHLPLNVLAADQLVNYATLLTDHPSSTSQISASTCLPSSNGGNANGSASMNTINREVLDGLKRISAKYKHIRGTYNSYKNNISGFFDFCGLSAQKDEILTRLNSYDKISGCQLERYKRCLRIIVERSQLMKQKSMNIMITRDSLVFCVAKILALGLAPFIPIENIYSIQRVGRNAVFSRITDRFKKQFTVTVSSNVEMRIFSRQNEISCWFINNMEDVDKFYLALDTLILFDPIVATTTTPIAIPVVDNKNKHSSEQKKCAVTMSNHISPLNDKFYVNER